MFRRHLIFIIVFIIAMTLAALPLALWAAPGPASADPVQAAGLFGSLAFIRNKIVCVYDTGTGNTTALSGTSNVTALGVNRATNEIIYATMVVTQGETNPYTIEGIMPDGSGHRVIASWEDAYWMEPIMSISPASSGTVAYYSHLPHEGVYGNIWKINMSTGERSLVLGLETAGENGEGYICPAVSPDGSKLACIHVTWDTSSNFLGAKICKMNPDATGRQDIITLDMFPDNLNSTLSPPAWSFDGRAIAFIDGDAEVYTAAPDGAGYKRVASLERAFSYPDWSPDGSHVSFDCYGLGNTKSVWTAPVTTGPPADLTGGTADTQGRWVLAQAHGELTGWHEQNNQSNGYALNAIDAVDADTAWAVGDHGVILKTMDGKSWVRQDSGTTQNLKAVSAVNATTAWAVGEGCTILKTEDGINWSAQGQGAYFVNHLNAVSAVSSSTCYAGGLEGFIKTEDGGSTWPGGGMLLNILSMSATDANHVWVGLMLGHLAKTSDGGNTWTDIIWGPDVWVYGVSGVSPDVFWAAGWVWDAVGIQLGGSAVKVAGDMTNFAGQVELFGNGNRILYAASAVNANTCWVVGNDFTIGKTSDGGATWGLQEFPEKDKFMPVEHFYDLLVGNRSYTQMDLHLNGVSAVDANTAWAVGDHGVIIKTTDGNNWNLQTLTAPWPLSGVSAYNRTTCWAVGWGGRIVKTTDGNSWVAQKSGTILDLYGVSSVDANTAWAVGKQGAILKISGSGDRWTAQSSQKPYQLYGVSAVNTNTCWTVGSEGTILKTTNGNSWSTQTSGTSSALNAVSAVNANTAWAVGDGGIILKTTDGQTWAGQASGTGAALRGVSAVNANTAWAVGDGGLILHTTDGHTWTNQASGTTDHLFSISALNEDTAWAVGDGGTIVHTTDGGANWARQDSGGTSLLYGVSAADASAVWAVGVISFLEGASILHTTDGGGPNMPSGGESFSSPGWVSYMNPQSIVSGIVQSAFEADGSQ